MIISHKYKFIYLRSQKTASTSIEVFLSAYCDDTDVVTIMTEETPEWHKGNCKLNGHVSAYDVREHIGDEIFNDYYKFTSIRNPLDKMLSAYFWWLKNPHLAPPNCRPDGMSFSEWIMKYDFNHTMAIFHHPYYKINGDIIADDYIRYETLENDLWRICGVLGIEYSSDYLLHYKKMDREDVEITTEARDKIRVQFKHELIDLKYEI